MADVSRIVEVIDKREEGKGTELGFSVEAGEFIVGGEDEGEGTVALSSGVVFVSSSCCEESGELIKSLNGGDKD